jgi:hypothetical protein
MKPKQLALIMKKFFNTEPYNKNIGILCEYKRLSGALEFRGISKKLLKTYARQILLPKDRSFKT